VFNKSHDARSFTGCEVLLLNEASSERSSFVVGSIGHVFTYNEAQAWTRFTLCESLYDLAPTDYTEIIPTDLPPLHDAASDRDVVLDTEPHPLPPASTATLLYRVAR